MADIRVIESSKYNKKWFQEKEGLDFVVDERGQEMQLLMVYSDIVYQEIKGFGGSFTQAAAYNYSKMNEVLQKEILESYFGKDGLDYNLCRTHINSCDFSFGNFTYCEKEDNELKEFNINCDQDYLIPFIKTAMEYKKERIALLASPWSPPAWMKTNGDMLKGGKLKEEYYEVWANYFVKYINAYRDQGIDVDMVTIQNEPKAIQPWESCIYTNEDEKIFIRDYLYPAFQKANLDVKIVIWDHNKEYCFERARHILADPKANEAVYGIAFHWYSGDHFENLRLCKELFPDKELIFTEGCVELTTTVTTMAAKANEAGGEIVATEAPWEFGECYAHDIMGNLNNGMSHYIDWNLLLDEQGGPNHVNNFCSAPIMCDTINQKLIYQPSYCFIGHMSKYIPIGSKRIAHSKYTSDLEVVTFITPDHKTIIVVMNQNDKEIELNIKDVVSNRITKAMINPKTITTFIY